LPCFCSDKELQAAFYAYLRTNDMQEFTRIITVIGNSQLRNDSFTTLSSIVQAQDGATKQIGRQF
jgi:hypothetical protein